MRVNQQVAEDILLASWPPTPYHAGANLVLYGHDNGCAVLEALVEVVHVCQVALHYTRLASDFMTGCKASVRLQLACTHADNIICCLHL